MIKFNENVLTPNHLVLTKYGWKKVKDVNPKDIIVLNR